MSTVSHSILFRRIYEGSLEKVAGGAGEGKKGRSDDDWHSLRRSIATAEGVWLTVKPEGKSSSQVSRTRTGQGKYSTNKDQSEREVAKSLTEGQMLLVVVSR